MATKEPELWIKCLMPGTLTPTHTANPWPKPGVWTKPCQPVMCRSGWHVLADTRQLLEFGLGYDVWLAEVDGAAVHGPDKSTWERARLVEQLPWDDRARRLFAADCAEDVLPIFERGRPGDGRPREAIRVARLFAEGKAVDAELAAARDAARAAARDAARDAAWAARAAGDAAWAAARAAAGDAAWAAARDAARAAGDAAWAAARAAQANRLADYLGLCHPGWEQE